MNPQTPCPDREKIFGLVHHLLEPEEEAEVRRHAFHCEKCLHVAQSFEKFDAVLDEWKGQNPSPWFDQRLKQKLAASRPAPAVRFFGLPSTRIFAAAMLVLMVVAGAYVIDELPRPETNTKQAEKTQVTKAQTPVTAPKPAPAQTPEINKTKTASKPLPPEEELKMYQNLGVLEDFDLLEGFDVLSELPKREAKGAH
jgi:hypothetical protein